MSKLPALKPRQIVAALLKAGFEKRRQRGSHLLVKHPVTRRSTTVAIHSKELKPESLREILKQAGLSEEDFLRFL